MKIYSFLLYLFPTIINNKAIPTTRIGITNGTVPANTIEIKNTKNKIKYINNIILNINSEKIR